MIWLISTIATPQSSKDSSPNIVYVLWTVTNFRNGSLSVSTLLSLKISTFYISNWSLRQIYTDGRKKTIGKHRRYLLIRNAWMENKGWNKLKIQSKKTEFKQLKNIIKI